MKLDLWQFDEEALKKTMQELPHSILKEQAKILSDKTDGLLHGRVTNIKFSSRDKTVNYTLSDEVRPRPTGT